MLISHSLLFAPTRGHLALSRGTLLPGFQMSALAVLPSAALTAFAF